MSPEMLDQSRRRLKIFARLKPIIGTELLELERAYEDRRLSAVAWIARNLLELDVGANYCRASEANAKAFDEDSARDVIGLFKLANLMTTAEAQSYLRVRADIIKDAKATGFHTIEDSYLRVSAAAEALGFEDIFKMANKALSKFAHPTALLMEVRQGTVGKILINGIAAEEHFIHCFYNGGRSSAESALAAINTFVEANLTCR